MIQQIVLLKILYFIRQGTNKYDVDFAKCVAICTYGTKAITRHRSNLIIGSQEIMLNVTHGSTVSYIEKLLPQSLYIRNGLCYGNCCKFLEKKTWFLYVNLLHTELR